MDQKIDNILLLVLQNKANIEEKAYFEKWLLEKDENKKIYNGLKAYWDQPNKIDRDRLINIKNSVWSTRYAHIPEKKSWFFYKIAAAIVFILVIGIALVVGNRDISEEVSKSLEVQWIEKTATSGVKLEFILPDGSLVKLNSESSIKYPSNFNDSLRELQLSGEAFFEVVHNKDKPFTVISKNVKTTVLGTTFIVCAYDDRPSVMVALDQGGVKTELIGTSDPEVNLLVPGEYIQYEENKQKKGVFSKNEVFGWKDGLLIFNHEDYHSAISKLERWFGVDFIREGEMPKWDINGEYKNASLESVLEAISYSTDFNYEFMDKKTVKLIF